ncbi:uncharacterized protein LOC124860652 isoform X3 [Girardinichthys multiradiatus]|uniref:uncharacterized protein LOC124860652 isoform X3 n=1 Tax=Girardinichthys multiradiatus TaxID=208333 RepID=UPI001FAC8EC7|nr:uncharacterized protein LOC124860652 isoform X3 [Girardinichthys multiradiatus]
MPRKGRRSEATKKRWRTLDLEDLQGSQPDVAKPRTSPPTAQAWTPTQSPEKKVEGTPTERTRPARRQPRRAAPTLEVDAPAESSPVPLEDHVRDDSCQASSLEPCASGPPVQTVRATHCQADYRYAGASTRREQTHSLQPLDLCGYFELSSTSHHEGSDVKQQITSQQETKVSQVKELQKKL